MARKKRRRKRRIRRNLWKAILTLFSVTALLAIFCYLAVVLFETKKINVTGNLYSSAQEVQKWVLSDKYSSNTLYILWKYNKDDIKQLPVIEKVKVKMKTPREVNIQVIEKTFSGRLDFNGESLYFDKDGMACLKTADVIEGVPYVEGMELDADKIKLGERLPVADETIFESIHSITELLKDTELTVDKYSCNGRELTLYFGVVRVQMGSSDYEAKLSQAVPILAKLQELYQGQAGVLHLENYIKSDSYIRFVPDPPPEEETVSEPAQDPDGSEGDEITWDTNGEG